MFWQWEPATIPDRGLREVSSSPAQRRRRVRDEEQHADGDEERAGDDLEPGRKVNGPIASRRGRARSPRRRRSQATASTSSGTTMPSAKNASSTAGAGLPPTAATVSTAPSRGPVQAPARP